MVVSMRDLSSDVLLIDKGRVVGSDQEAAVGVLADWAVEIGAVKALTPVPFRGRYCGLLGDKHVIECFRVHRVICVHHRVVHSQTVVVSNMLLRCACDAVVVLIDS